MTVEIIQDRLRLIKKVVNCKGDLTEIYKYDFSDFENTMNKGTTQLFCETICT